MEKQFLDKAGLDQYHALIMAEIPTKAEDIAALPINGTAANSEKVNGHTVNVDVDVATESAAGIVKPDGTTIKIAEGGVISAVGAGTELTKAEYDALPEEQKMNGTTYFIRTDTGSGLIYRNGYEYSGGGLVREITQAEYDALPEDEKNNGTIYFIIDGGSMEFDASDIDYDNTTSGLTGNTVQAAIDELAQASPAIATTESAGIVKPDGTTITITDDGTISSIGGGDSGVELTKAEYEALTPEEKMNGTTYYVKGATPSQYSAENISFAPTERIVATNAQSAIEEVDEKVGSWENPKQVTDLDDINWIPETGFGVMSFLGSASNSPSNSRGIAFTRRYAPKYATQWAYINQITQNAVVRHLDNGTWGAWKAQLVSGEYVSITDCDNATSVGVIYYAASSATNKPESGGYWQIVPYASGADYITQMAYRINGGSDQIYTRRKMNGVWQSWNKLVTEESLTCNSLNDSTISQFKGKKIGDTCTVQGIILCKSGTTLNSSVNLAHISVGTTGFMKWFPCVYRNSGSGAVSNDYLTISTNGNISPASTNTTFNEIRFNFTYTC